MTDRTMQILSDAALQAIRTELETMCIGLAAGDLPATDPLYVVYAHELDGFSAATCDGWVSTDLDQVAARAIGPRWRGRGPTIALNVQRLEQVVERTLDDRFDPAVHRSLAASLLRAICLHELGHVLADAAYVPPRGAAPLAAAEVALRHTDVQAWATTSRTAGDLAKHLFGHDLKWIRAVLHLLDRDERACVRTGRGPRHLMSQALNTEMYLLSPAGQYASALGDERQRLATLSIRAVLAEPVPAEFSALWWADLTAWPDRYQSLTAEAA